MGEEENFLSKDSFFFKFFARRLIFLLLAVMDPKSKFMDLRGLLKHFFNAKSRVLKSLSR